MNKTRVLIVPGTTEIAREYVQSLKANKNTFIIGAGTDVELGKSMGYQQYLYVPSIYDEGFYNELSEIVSVNNIQLVIPAHDQLQFDLSKKPIAGTTAMLNPPETQGIIRSKHATYKFFMGETFVPEIYDSNSHIEKFPIFLKPDVGQGSRGVVAVYSIEELNSLQVNFNSSNDRDFFTHYVVSEYLPGDELTVDCFSTLKEGLLFHSPRKRSRVRSGVSVETKQIESSLEIDEIAAAISKKLKFSGAWFFQIKKSVSGLYKLLEVGGRLAGSSGLRRSQGINLAQLSVLSCMGEDVTIPSSKVGAGFIHRRLIQDSFQIDFKFEILAIDLDDTLILGGFLNIQLIALIHECISSHKKVWLVTRHRFNPIETLRKHRVSDLFDEIIHVTEKESKADYLRGEMKILFIDDSFKERQSCSMLQNVLALDVSAIDGLLQGLTSSLNRSQNE